MHIIREVMAEAENPVMLYSVGKDSSVMLHQTRKAFYPSPPPFPLLHVDTRWKFQAMYDFRDHMAQIRNGSAGPHQSRGGREEHQPTGPRLRAPHRRHENPVPEAGTRSPPVRCRVRRRPPGRGEVPRQGACSRSGPRRTAGTPRTSAPSSGTSTTAARIRARVSGCSPLELDRARHLAVHLPGADPDRAALLRGRASGGRARWDADDGRRRPADDLSRRADPDQEDPVPDPRLLP